MADFIAQLLKDAVKEPGMLVFDKNGQPEANVKAFPVQNSRLLSIFLDTMLLPLKESPPK